MISLLVYVLVYWSLFFKILLFWTILKVFIICHDITSDLCFGLLSHKACEILAPSPGIKPASSALVSKVLTTVQPGKSPAQTLELC